MKSERKRYIAEPNKTPKDMDSAGRYFSEFGGRRCTYEMSRYVMFVNRSH